MSELRGLINQAFEDIQPAVADPFPHVTRTAMRRRRRQAVVSTVVVLLIVAAAIAIPLSLRASGKLAVTHRDATKATVMRLAPDDGEETVGFGSAWGLECCGTVTGKAHVDELNPSTGRMIRRILVPAPALQLTNGAGKIWVIGSNPGGGGPSSISAINPESGQVITLRIKNPQGYPYQAAATDGSLWVTLPGLNEVWRLDVRRGQLHKSSVAVPGEPWTIATTGDGALWVQQQIGDLSEIVPTRSGGEIVRSVHWSGHLFGPSGPHGLLASTGGNDLETLVPQRIKGCLGCAETALIKTIGSPLAAVQTPRGLFATTTKGTYFYGTGSRSAPTFRITVQGGSIDRFDSGVVIGAGAYGIVHWIPAAAK